MRYSRTPGKNPASAIPSSIRSVYSEPALGTKAIAAAMIPHVSMIRAIHRRAPNLCSARLLGTSNRRYPMKKRPEARPNMVSVSPSSSLMVSFASPIFVRSR